MSVAIYGIGLGGGITIGKAYIIDKNLYNATFHNIDQEDINLEITRFENALKSTRLELEILRKNIPSNAPAELGAFISLNIMMLNDSQISKIPLEIIKNENCNAEWALKIQADKLSETFENMQDQYLKERKYDIIQVLERIFKNLSGNHFNHKELSSHKTQILVTHDLSPADLLSFKESNFIGFVTEVGSLTSHTAIIGRNLEIPSIVGVSYAREIIKDGELIIVDGVHGALIINPDKIILDEYTKKQKQWLETKVKLRQIRRIPALTLDNTKINLYANIEHPDDVDDVKYNYADGIGLYRSEFLFLDNQFIDEYTQFEVYHKLCRNMKDLPVIIRTADFAADKNPINSLYHHEVPNPALGLSGVRLSLTDHVFFRTQLKAILKASHYGNINIMFPMVSTNIELIQAINHLNFVKEELIEEKIPFNKNIKIGAMIEVPSIAIAINSILPLVDFISIGTNDLIQYLLAIDRNNEDVNYLYNPLHPAVIKIISSVIKSANKVNVPVSICGEMAGNAKLTRLLLGLGLKNFSMYSSNILNIKNVILNTNILQTQKIVNRILRTYNLEKIESLINELNSDIEDA